MEDKEQEILEESTGVSFKLENFEGPLDLLLYLIKKSKMEIEDVELSSITEQYLQIIQNMDTIDMEAASEFIEMAAILIEIKSKALLPREPEETDEISDEEMLKMRLREYQVLKESFDKLRARDDTNRFYRAPDPKANKVRIVLKDMQLDMLLDAFQNLMIKVNSKKEDAAPKEIQKERFTVAEKISALRDTMMLRDRVQFSELFDSSISREEIITTFMALLELLKMQEIRVTQDANYADITIMRRVDDDNNGEENGETK